MSATLKIVENIGIYSDYENQVDFDSIEDQTAFWNAKVTATYSDLQMKFVNDHTIKVLGNFNSMKNASYCFIDTLINGTAKRYYYFIIDRKLLSYGQDPLSTNDDTVQLDLEEDVFQTYMFDYGIAESFIKREHQDRFTKLRNDGYIFNTEQENLEIGSEYEIKSSKYIGGSNHLWYMVYAKEPLGKHYYVDSVYAGTEVVSPTPTEIASPSLYSGTYLNTGYYIYLISGPTVSYVYNNTVTASGNTIRASRILEDTKVAKIVATRYIPTALMWSENSGQYFLNANELSVESCILHNSTGELNRELIFINTIRSRNYVPYISPDYETFSLSPNADINISKEPKLLTYPYSYDRINVFGKYGIIKNEDWDSYVLKNYMIRNGFGNNTNLIVRPLNYLKDYEHNEFKQIQSNVNSEVNLRTDAWNQYVANNSASINGGLAVKTIGAATSIIGGMATGNYLAAGVGAIGFGTQIANEMIKRQDIKNMPDEINQSPSDTYNSLPDNNVLVINDSITIKREYLTKAFNYFLHFGYACNNFKVPELRSRFYYNYIQSLGIKIVGNLNNKIIENLQKIYDKGITIWHYREDMKGESPTYQFRFLDYSKENAEMNLKSYWS